MGSATFKAAIEDVAFQPPLKRRSLVVPDDAEEHVVIGDHSKLPVLVKRTATRGRPWLLIFHGSGEDAVSSFCNYGRKLQDQLDVNIALPEYPHYGRSSPNDDEHEEEAPSEKGVYNATALAHALLTRTFNVRERDIIAFGISIGGGAAADLASRGGVAALILQSTFVSVVRVRMWTPWSCACDPFQTGDKLATVASSCRGVLILHGDIDTTVRVKHAHAIADGLRDSEGMRLVTFPDRGHGDLFKDDAYFGVVREFIDVHTRPESAGAGLVMTNDPLSGTAVRRTIAAGAAAGSTAKKE